MRKTKADTNPAHEVVPVPERVMPTTFPTPERQPTVTVPLTTEGEPAAERAPKATKRTTKDAE